jgi:putative Mn2+ efflux pump MntP
MTIFEIILMAVALAMDAFAVAICKGLATKKVQIKHMVIVGAWFGIFQALMPFIGCTIGAAFLSYIEAVDHWIAFVLLGFIGANMIRESLSKEEGDGCEGGYCSAEESDASLAPRVMLTMAIATSIDALAAGVGITVTGANNVIHLERHWNPAKEAQASDRVYRIGQKKDVNIYIPILEHPEKVSFDRNLDQLLQHKIDLKDAVVTPGDIKAEDFDMEYLLGV